MASVTYEQVVKKFDEVTVFKSFDLKVHDGEFLVLVGPSGCGKSTALRMLAGLETITDGKIYIGDRVVNNVAPKDRDIAMVFQSYALYPHMTVFDNMAFGLRLRGVARDQIDEGVRSAARSLGIEPLLDRRPRQLSGGQRQRVAVGRAIVREPAVFLLDEPLSNLDAKLRVEARAFINRLHKQLQTTFIYVTHDQVEAMTMGDRICVLNAGELQQVDPPGALYHNPRNIFVGGFIGSPSMNFFDAKLTKQNGKIIADANTFNVTIPDWMMEPIGDHVDKQVVLGIRPEDIHHADYQPSDINPEIIEAHIDVIEQMGNEIIVYLTDDKNTFLGRIDPRANVDTGQKVRFAINADNVHIFDADTELSLVFDYKREHPPEILQAQAGYTPAEQA
ncbi:MAG: ABC transporter ATP-binding protein [Chloroflexota bacterium]